MKKLILAVLFSMISLSAFAEIENRQEYYTKVNIWYKDRREVLTLYHVGGIIPAGTKVMVLTHGNRKVVFKDVQTGVEYRLIEPRKYSAKINKQAWLQKYFSKENPLDYDGFTEIERQAINKGEVKYGMSKRAVYTAYGYPPTHKTSGVFANRWWYWSSKLMNFAVDFEDDKVFKIKGKTEQETKQRKQKRHVEQSTFDLTYELEKLGKLYKEGILTEDEFIDAKRKLIY